MSKNIFMMTRDADQAVATKSDLSLVLAECSGIAAALEKTLTAETARAVALLASEARTRTIGATLSPALTIRVDDPLFISGGMLGNRLSRLVSRARGMIREHA